MNAKREQALTEILLKIVEQLDRIGLIVTEIRREQVGQTPPPES